MGGGGATWTSVTSGCHVVCSQVLLESQQSCSDQRTQDNEPQTSKSPQIFMQKEKNTPQSLQESSKHTELAVQQNVKSFKLHKNKRILDQLLLKSLFICLLFKRKYKKKIDKQRARHKSMLCSLSLNVLINVWFYLQCRSALWIK